MARELVLLLPTLLLLLVKTGHCADFQSDELEDEEWGIVGNLVPPPRAASVESAPSDSSKLQFPLEHAFGGSEFSPAGTFNARLRPSLRGGQTLVKLRLSRNPFSEAEKKAFKELVQKDGFYSIRVPATPLSPGKTFVISSAKARCLVAADFSERLDIYMEQGHIISVGYNAAEGCNYPRVLKYPTKWSFDTHIVSKSGEQASRFAYVGELEASADEKLGDENLQLQKPVEKSFWAKYWIYIIPLGIIVMNAITQIANLPDEQPGGAQGQQAAAPTAAGAGAGRGASIARRR